MKWTIYFLLFSVLITAQESKYLKSIDSLNQKNWQKNGERLDSLSDVKLAPIYVKPVDSIAIDYTLLMPELPKEIPLTPFNLLRMKASKKWFYYGQNTLVFNQSSFSNWNTGGNNNIGVIGKLNYQINYKKDRHFLDFNLKAGYGLVATSGQTTRKTEDFMDFSGNYGYDLGKNYYLSTGLQFISQFQPGYNYGSTPDPTKEDRISNFLAPAYVNLGLGISYNPQENFQVIFRPINGKFTIVADEALQKAGKFGLDKDGQFLRSELGAMLNFQYRLNIYENAFFTNNLNFFTNYLFHPERVDIGYSGVLNMKFNKFISTLVSLDLLYDHDQIQKLQIKQTLGVGISYNFGFVDDDKDLKKKLIRPFFSK